MFSIELQLIPFVANPKGGNRTLRVRIRGRYMLTFSWHLIKHVSLRQYNVSLELKLISVVANPKGGNRTLRVRIRGRYILTFSWHLMKKVDFLKYYIFKWIGTYPVCGEPKGRKPNAASQNPLSIQIGLRILDWGFGIKDYCMNPTPDYWKNAWLRRLIIEICVIPAPDYRKMLDVCLISTLDCWKMYDSDARIMEKSNSWRLDHVKSPIIGDFGIGDLTVALAGHRKL